MFDLVRTTVRLRVALRLALVVLGLFGAASLVPAGEPAAKSVDFSRDIRPILAKNCWSCHGPDVASREAELRLDDQASALARKAIVPGDPAASKLLTRINATNPARLMPPPESKRSLSERERKLLHTWIQQGGQFAQHWAFVKPKKSPLPTVLAKNWTRNPIDAFVLHKLEQAGLAPSPEADRSTLLRRVSLDLTGLPPSPEAVAAFEADEAADAYERIVDRLLESPQYAERMAMAWLDLARYADTNGFNNDAERTMWPWRDWVIDAFHKNMPHDQFIVEQLAGDLLPDATQAQKVATGFLRNQVHNTEGGIIVEEYRVEYVADRVHTTATVFMGLSLQCARCHDHKYDPFSTREYYQLYAYFNEMNEPQASYGGVSSASPFLRLPSPEQTRELAAFDQQRQELEGKLKSTPPPGEAEQKTLKSELDALLKKRQEVDKHVPLVMVMADNMTKPRATHVLKRGDYDKPGDLVRPGVPAVFPPLPQGAPGNRLGLAQWLVHPDHPLTARVTVNRWWQMFFGTGLVKTIEDFGQTGETPSHPELLDYLATELVHRKWNMKALHRLIVTSATYRQRSQTPESAWAKDPENRLLGRGPRQRLSAEMVRDNALAVSGLLRERVGGPSVRPYQPAGLWEDVSVSRGAKYVADKGENLYRRSMYTFWKRTCPPPGLMSFDAPNREVCVARRSSTNTPLQALVLLNDPTYVEAARKLAERMVQQGKSPEETVEAGYRLALARKPSPAEVTVMLRIHAAALARFKDNKTAVQALLAVGESPVETKVPVHELAAWTTVASTLLNLDETITKE